MALFAIQLVRVVLTSLTARPEVETSTTVIFAMDYVIGIHEMINVIIKICSFSTSFVLLITFTWLARASHQQ